MLSLTHGELLSPFLKTGPYPAWPTDLSVSWAAELKPQARTQPPLHCRDGVGGVPTPWKQRPSQADTDVLPPGPGAGTCTARRPAGPALSAFHR